MTTPTPHGAMPELPEIPPSDCIPYDAIRYVAGYPAGYVQRYATEYAKLCLARAAIQQAAGAVPGWQLVPVEPTAAMLEASLRAFEWGWTEPCPELLECGAPVESGITQEEADQINADAMKEHAMMYRAFLAASPSPLGREAGKEGSSDHLVPCAGGGVTQPLIVDGCGCATCKPMDWLKPGTVRMILCATCGNKRCPHANDHRNACTGSNDPGQPGSSYPRLELCRHGNANCLVCRNGIHRRPDAPTSQINPGSAPREDGHG